jgi:tRNA (mo5U34)-methyltransferase
VIDLGALQFVFRQHGLDAWATHLPDQMRHAFERAKHGDFDRWRHIVEGIPPITTEKFDLAADTVRIGNEEELDPQTRKSLEQSLRALQPWRKGPFSVFGINIDTEWRSDWKWQRLQPHISPLHNRRVLDVGCGSGYHCWRMMGEGAELVVGIDPNMLFLSQFSAIKRLMANAPEVHLLPVGIEALPSDMKAFDTVFSMGILYHRRSPMEHLAQLREALRKGGELVLETLVIEGDERQVLVPQGRYAKMRNVWFIPSAHALKLWLEKCGFSDVRIVDVTATTTDEQHATNWMSFESLADFLDPVDQAKTVEGHPSPVRAVLLAKA